MKSCPLCQREYSSDTNFCLDDGQMLISAPPRPQADSERELTLMNAVRQTAQIPAQPPYSPPAVWQPATLAHPFVQPPSKTLATTSLVLALVSITVGWCCFAGVILGPAAIITGAIATSNIAKHPSRYTGRNAAIAGIILGALNLLLYGLVLAIIG